jgi:tripartite-type tricarboxylate transporter receptor subunit TctC
MKRVLLPVVFCLIAGGMTLVSAQGFPNRGIQTIVSFTPGLGSDVAGRIVKQGNIQQQQGPEPLCS